MHVVSRYTAADAAGIIEPRGRAIALSVAFAAGVSPCCWTCRCSAR